MIDMDTPTTALRLLRHLRPERGGQVLEIGCGRGTVTFPLAEAVGEDGEVYGIDQTAEVVDALSALAKTTGVRNLVVRRMDVQNPTYAPHDFDAVTGDMTIAMLPDLPAALAHYRELLKPGGRLVFSAPSDPLIQVRDPDAVADLLTRAGFTDVVVHHEVVADLHVAYFHATAPAGGGCPFS